jgi:SAM-dependent methyltransferase
LAGSAPHNTKRKGARFFLLRLRKVIVRSVPKQGFEGINVNRHDGNAGNSKALMSHSHRWSRIDAEGCVYCRGGQFTQSAVINNELANSWELSRRARILFDKREGHFCRQCGMSKRVRMLAWTVMRFVPDLSGKKVLHFNQINQFHPVVQSAAELVETIYRPDLKFGEQVDGFINQDITRLQFPEASFDLAVHSDTLEHVFDYEKALNEVRRLLKPGGFQIYTVPLLHKRRTRQRIGQVPDGRLVQLLPPSGHGLEGEYPVIWEFGGDFLLSRKSRSTRVFYDNYWTNPSVFAIAEQKPLQGN